MSDLKAFFLGVAASAVATLLLKYANQKRKGYYKQKIDDLEYEKERIEAISKKPTELYRDSFRNLFYLIFIISFANIIRLVHGLMYDEGVVWQQGYIEGGLWFIVAYLSLKFKKRIDFTYNKSESISKLNDQIKTLEKKC